MKWIGTSEMLKLIDVVSSSGRFTLSEAFIWMTSMGNDWLNSPGLHHMWVWLWEYLLNTYPSKSLGRKEFDKNAFDTGPGYFSVTKSII